MGLGPSVQYYEEVWIIPVGSRSASGALIGSRPGLCGASENTLKNGLGMRKTWIEKTIGLPWNPHFYGVFTQVHNTL
jgi:hypothetical protein